MDVLQVAKETKAFDGRLTEFPRIFGDLQPQGCALIKMIVTIILVVAKFLRDTSAEGEGEGKEKKEKPQGAEQTKIRQHTTEPPPKTPTAEGLLAQALGQDL